MPDLDPVELKRRRRVAARTLLSDLHGSSVAKKKHLVDGVWVDKLPFDAGHAWRTQQALLEADRLEVEAWEASSSPRAADAEVLFAEPAQPAPEPDSCCTRFLRSLPRVIQVHIATNGDGVQ